MEKIESLKKYFTSTELNYQTVIKFDPKTYKTYRNFAHVMYFGKVCGKLFHTPVITTALMQIRDDGMLGFPGGVIDAQDDIVEGLNRKLMEEMGLNDVKMQISLNDKLATYIDQNTKELYHFFTKEILEDELNRIEMACINSRDWGNEVYGLIRVPLSNPFKHFPFPQFLNNNFIGNSRVQLCHGLCHANLMSVKELDLALHTSHKMLSTN